MVLICMSPLVRDVDVDCLFMLFIGHLYILSGEMSVRIPRPVLTVEFCVELWSSSGHFLEWGSRCFHSSLSR